MGNLAIGAVLGILFSLLLRALSAHGRRVRISKRFDLTPSQVQAWKALRYVYEARFLDPPSPLEEVQLAAKASKMNPDEVHALLATYALSGELKVEFGPRGIP